MVRKIMVGYRRDRHGEDALALARALASSSQVEEILVVESVGSGAAGDVAETEHGWPSHVRFTARSISGDSVPDALAALAETEQIDLVVLGSTHRGFAGRVLVGTTAGSLLKESTCRVSIAPPGWSGSPTDIRRVGVAVDGSEGSLDALRWAAELSSSRSGSLRLIGVVEPPPPVESWGGGVPPETWASGLSYVQSAEAVDISRERVQHELIAAAATVGRDDAEAVTVIGEPAHELRSAAEDLDMLVVGSHGRGRLAGALLGSVSRSLAHSCPAPLTVVPLPAER